MQAKTFLSFLTLESRFKITMNLVKENVQKGLTMPVEMEEHFDTVDKNLFEEVEQMLLTASTVLKVKYKIDAAEKLVTKIDKIWLSTNKRFVVVELKFSLFDDAGTRTLGKAVYPIDRARLHYDVGNSAIPFKEILKNTIDTYLFIQLVQKRQIGIYYLIPEKMPDTDRIWSEYSNIDASINRLVRTQLLPTIAERLQEAGIKEATYGVKLWNPQFSLAPFPNFEKKKSTITITAELVDKQLQPFGQEIITTGFRFEDYSGLAWLFEGSEEFDLLESSMSGVRESFLSVIDQITKEGVDLKFDGISLSILSYEGLAVRDLFIIGEEDGKIKYNLSSVQRQFESQALDHIMLDLKPLNESQTAFIAQMTNGLILFIGDNGISSPKGIIYKRGDENRGSLQKARLILRKLLNSQDEQISVFLASFDGRKNRSPLAGKTYKHIDFS